MDRGMEEGWKRRPPSLFSPGEGGNNGSHKGRGGGGAERLLSCRESEVSIGQKYVVRERGTVSDIIYTPETAGAEAHTIKYNIQTQRRSLHTQYKIPTAREAYTHSSTNIFT